ncbi:TRAFAC clade GTPase domain-containing protein [Leptospira saintgironsiae]|uniref:Double-GTPase 2 domain-containing protein n=1 Tax=Leptospira saintgironsiae TaxID=2023183 RepID=A0A2M9Y7L4_9LEPT|nr:hypothetical protein [Leptospira saintgironsiae]PJZ47554.1 hypothetical protein CH362_18610 [Leptospira saintgironsiae]
MSEKKGERKKTIKKNDEIIINESSIDLENVEFFKNIVKKFTEIESDQIILSIPVWGWQDTGKTTSILTAGYFLNCVSHGISLSVVNYLDELERLQDQNDWMKKNGIIEVAISSKSIFLSASKDFIDNNSWPPGTDAHTPYFFRIDKPNGQLGYLYIPDIPGGSFQDATNEAIEVLESADGIVVIIDPQLYNRQNSLAKHYKDEIRGVLFASAKRKIPIAIFITKSDNFSGIDSAIIDDVNATLEIIKSSVEAHDIEVFRTSVIGFEIVNEKIGTQDEKKLPESNTRKPELLLKGWIWLLFKAIHRSIKIGVNDKINFHPSVSLGNRKSLSSSNPDIREIGSLTNQESYPILSIQSPKEQLDIISAANDGTLRKQIIKVKDSAISTGSVLELGKITDPPEDIFNLKFQYNNGSLIAGKSKEADVIWSGILGEEIKKRPIENTIASWNAFSQNEILTLNNGGKISLISLNGDEWLTKKFIPLFSKKSAVSSLRYEKKLSSVLAIHGTESEGVKLIDGTFDERLKYNLKKNDDVIFLHILPSLEVFAISNEGKLRIFSEDNVQEIEGANITNLELISFGLNNSRIAFISADNTLRICFKDKKGQFQITGNKYSVKLTGLPDSVILDESENYVICSFREAMIWRVFKIYGL